MLSLNQTTQDINFTLPVHGSGQTPFSGDISGDARYIVQCLNMFKLLFLHLIFLESLPNLVVATREQIILINFQITGQGQTSSFDTENFLFIG